MNENESNPQAPVEAPKANTAAPTYDNNPFMLVIRGIERVFDYAKPIAITLLVLSIISGVASFALNFASAPEDEAEPTGESFGGDAVIDPSMYGTIGLVVLLIALGGMLLAVIVNGIADYAAAAASNNRKVKFSEALDQVLKNFWPYLLLRILIFAKLMLWALLFLLPSLYFNYRYALSGIVFFSEGKRGNQAIKRSLALTKDAWVTTFSSYSIVALLTGRMIQMLSDTATGSELYRNFRSVVDTNHAHPKPHVISWVFMVIIILLIALVLLMLALVIAAFSMYLNESGGAGMETLFL